MDKLVCKRAIFYVIYSFRCIVDSSHIAILLATLDM
jgi:hypothetical protein